MYLKLVLFLTIFVPNAAFAAIDYFLMIDGVDGESTAVGHEDEIDIHSVSWVVTSSGRLACIEGLNFIKVVDLASPQLLMGQAEGRVYPKAVLTARKAGENRFEFLVITLHNVHIGSLSAQGSAGTDNLTENLTLNFERAVYQYTIQNPDGGPGRIETADVFSRSRCK